jgi:hypothetical protein
MLGASGPRARKFRCRCWCRRVPSLLVNADEQQDLRKLLELLERAKPWEELTGNPSDAWRVQAGSALAGDDAKTNPYQLSHAAWHALTVAVDHLHCLRSSLAGKLEGDRLSVRIHTHAQSSLVRGAIENGARAVWLLGPATRLLRVKRRLSLEAMEVRHSYRLRELAKAPAPRTQDQREKQLRDLAIAAGVPDPDVKKALKSPQYSDIVREAGDLTVLGADLAAVIWSGCSSIAHGDLSGTLGMLDKEILARDKGIAYTRVTGSISGLYWTTAGAVRMIEHGFNLYRQRAARHY